VSEYPGADKQSNARQLRDGEHVLRCAALPHPEEVDDHEERDGRAGKNRGRYLQSGQRLKVIRERNATCCYGSGVDAE